MVGLCTPNPDTPDEILGRLLSVLFHWFHVTSFSYTGEFIACVICSLSLDKAVKVSSRILETFRLCWNLFIVKVLSVV